MWILTTEKDPKAQHKRFVEKARKSGCDEDENRFNPTFKKIAKHERKKNGKDPVRPS